MNYFEQVSHFIDFEKLAFVLKQFFIEVKEKELFSFENKNLFLEKYRHKAMSDSDILKKLLPESLSQHMFSGGNKNLLAFVFAFRHKIFILNTGFHRNALIKKNQFYSNEFKILDQAFSMQNYFSALNNSKIFTQEYWGLKSDTLPVFGFSALGCYFIQRPITHCRAFDAYDIPCCHAHASGLFCTEHQAEAFWQKETREFYSSSTQAKMFDFYAEKENFYKISDQDLEEFMRQFYQKYQKSQSKFNSTSKPLPLNECLAYYGFSNQDELNRLGYLELRKRFLEKAKEYHPDRAPLLSVHEHSSCFQEAKIRFETLRELTDDRKKNS
ncbi:MAG: hypothetical protein K2X39_02335 [Silvanigrellaceae bacterium]|nr:hypothetical protein [Silvanigrellaceae bacterium]